MSAADRSQGQYVVDKASRRAKTTSTSNGAPSGEAKRRKTTTHRSSKVSDSAMSSECPSSRNGHVAAVVNNEMLLWGGVSVEESTGDEYYCSPDVIECFDLFTGQWNRRQASSDSPSDLPHPCSDSRIGVVRNRDIYQFGGSYFTDGRRAFSSDLHKLDGLTLEWERIIPKNQATPTGRSLHGVCVLGKEGDEHLVLMGGLGENVYSTTPKEDQFVPDPTDPDVGWSGEVWLFSPTKSE